MNANDENKTEQLAAELAKAKREIEILKREKRRVGLSFYRIPETGHDISRLWNGDFPYLQKMPNNCLEKTPSDPTFHGDANTVLIEADNLAALMAMQLTHKGKIDVIYIDPPYNTGNNDFIYNDARKSSIKDVEGASGSDYESNLDGKARMVGKDDPERHSLWLSFMERRLWLAKELLSDKGVIFISIDDNEQARLKVLMDSVFGESAFLGDFVWKKKAGGSNNSKKIALEHEYIICYGKSQETDWHEQYSEKYARRYKEKDEKGLFYYDTLQRNTGSGKQYPIVCPDGRIVQFKEDGEPIRWLWSEQTFKEKLSSGEVNFKLLPNGQWSIRFKQRMPEGKKPRSIILDMGFTSDGAAMLTSILGGDKFDNPKPVALIKYLIRVSSLSKDSTILDFFAGSGTTAHAVAELNKEDGGSRQCILVTHGDEDGKNIAEDVTAERMKRVLSGKNWADGKEHEALPGSLIYYKLLFAPKTSNPLTAMETMQTRFTGLAAMEQEAHVQLANEQNYTVLMNSETVVVVWKNGDALLDEPESEFYPLLERLKLEHPEASHIVYTPSNQSSDADEYGVGNYGWINYSYPMEYLAAHAALIERMKRNKTMLQPFANLQDGEDVVTIDEAHSSVVEEGN